MADGTPVPSPAPAGQTDGSEQAPYGDPGTANVVGTTSPTGPTSASSPARGSHEEDRDVEDEADGAGEAGGAEAGSGAEGDILLSAREVRGKRVMPSERRPVVRRNGRPSVPPLALPGESGATGRERARRPDGAGTAERPPRERPERTEQSEEPEEPEQPAQPAQPAQPERAEQTDDVERSQPVEPVDEPVEPQGVRDEPRPRLLSDRARDLADELEGRAGGRRRDEQNGPSGSR